MTRRALTCSACTALMAAAGAPTVAHSQANGYITLRGGTQRIQIPGPDAAVTSYAGDAAVVFQSVGRYNVQLNGFLERSDDNDLISERETFGADAHLFWGRPDAYTVGGFVSVFEIDLEDFANETVYGGGLEFDHYANSWTTSLQGGYFVGEELNAYGVSGQSRIYATPRFSIEGAAAIGEIDDDAVEGEAYGFGAEAEYMFPNTPLSIIANAHATKYPDIDTDITTATLGLRWSLGASDLLERDRTGASMRGSQTIGELLAR